MNARLWLPGYYCILIGLMCGSIIRDSETDLETTSRQCLWQWREQPQNLIKPEKVQIESQDHTIQPSPRRGQRREPTTTRAVPVYAITTIAVMRPSCREKSFRERS